MPSAEPPLGYPGPTLPGAQAPEQQHYLPWQQPASWPALHLGFAVLSADLGIDGSIQKPVINHNVTMTVGAAACAWIVV